jgi:hypothetical protein
MKGIWDLMVTAVEKRVSHSPFFCALAAFLSNSGKEQNQDRSDPA